MKKKTEKGELKIKQDPNNGFYVDGLSIFSVKDEKDLMKKLKMGNKSRKVRATNMNEYSSRSHTIFTIGRSKKWSSRVGRTRTANCITRRAN